MTTFGKVLLVVNLLAAAGVAYYATATWAKRQGPNEQLAKYYLIMVGLPHESTGPASTDPNDEVRLDAQTGGGTSIDHISRKALDAHFGGPAPTSRKAAVEDMQKDKLGKLRGAPPDAVLAELVGRTTNNGAFEPGTLLLLADGFDERQAYRSLLADQAAAPANATTAVDALAGKFTAALSPAVPPDPNANPLAGPRAKVTQASADLQAKAADAKTKLNALVALTNPDAKPTEQEADDSKRAYNGAVEAVAKAEKAVLDATAEFTRAAATTTAAVSEADRRRRVAALLVCVDRSAAGQKRALLALGQRGYLDALHDRVNRLDGIKQRFDSESGYATARFALLYDQKRKAAQDLEALAVTQKTLADSLDGAVKKSADLLAQRTAERDDAKASAEAVEKAVNDGLAEQAVTEGELLALQKRVGALLRENYDLEDQLRAKERGGK